MLFTGIVSTQIYAQQLDNSDNQFLPIEQLTQEKTANKSMSSLSSTAQLTLQSTGIVVGGDAWTGPNYAPGEGLVSLGDVTGDGKNDLLVTSLSGSDRLYLFHESNGDYIFSEIDSYGNSGANIGDINYDGVNDFAVGDFFTQSVRV